MSKKRQSSSIVSIMDEDNMDLHEIDDENALSAEHDSVNYMNMTSVPIISRISLLKKWKTKLVLKIFT